ncbi:hypothetical protein QBC44DRAFT_371097 [Cladorrhinum sp. PSN332]|nr:hypothetical protein QBC44DRAFT_371097 [Cladorrhinum sp. PSN332]
MSGPSSTDNGGQLGFPVIDYGDPALLPHDDAGPQLLAVGWSLWCMAAAFLATRIYCKRVGGRGLWWDDHFLFAAQLIHLVSTCLLTQMVSTGYGKHPWDKPNVSPIPTSSDLLIMMTRTTFTITAIAWSKTAFAITMLRFVNGWTKWGVWFIIVSMNVALGLSAMIPWLLCDPVNKLWDSSVQGGSCRPFTVSVVLAYVSGAYSAVCDLVLALLPWVILSGLHMRPKEKLGVGIAMSMGIVAAIMATVKTVSLNKLSSTDSYDTAQLNIYDTAEISVTIMAASIPAMRVLLNDLRSSARSGGRHYYQTSTPQYGANRSGIVITVKAAGSGGEDRPTGRDDMSDRRILGSRTEEGKIYRVDEVEVASTYSHRKEGLSDEEGGYEMQDTGRKG